VAASNAAGTYYHYLDNEEVNIIAVEAAGLGVDSGESCYLRARESRCYSWRQDPIDAIYGWANYRTIFYFGRIRLPRCWVHANLYATGRAQFISITDEQAMQWGLKLSKMEGIIPAIETAHAFAVLDEMKFKPEDMCKSIRTWRQRFKYVY
jgi:tryptophan synthase beta chain